MNVRKYIQHSFILSLVLFLLVATLFHPKSASAATNDPLKINAKAAILVDVNSGKILYAKNIDEMLPPASMTKMMTEYLVQKSVADGKLKWDTTFRVSQKASDLSHNTDFSGVSLRTDYDYTVKSLYEALAIFSSNAAAVALAEKISGSETEFVKLMNKTAKDLGMDDAKFINSSGLDNVDLGDAIAAGGPNDSNMVSARSLAKLAYHIVTDYPQALEVSSIPEKDFIGGPGEKQHMTNYNYMLPGFGDNMREYKYPGVDGLKTGFTDAAGECFTGTVKQGNRRFISVVMHTESESARFLETKKLYDYGFKQTSDQSILKKGASIKDKKSLPVVKGKQDHVDIEVKDAVTLPIDNSDKGKYKTVLHLDKSLLNKDGELTAPVKKGQKVGYITLENTGDHNYGYLYNAPKIDVVAKEDVQKSNWFVLTLRSIGHFISGIFTGAVDLVKGWF
ncbi:D-alanyl-D-alanine carboxypeptidase (penicillin-binding protein 5/6) [Pullulanibacillus pueri]|uniref:serine-type D-Ala-D-Ala carboxypeptidase n=1 Tax=Pullulanibacillus pueri TaxID=1437324 RepID=A0A8J2ZVW5_9BACL|nr:serine hydrolase [Pullulanibacillus pueri]MBM7682155.1 D-alanyl-D-alanine carboxypeptidase (penicillin-binding protein 5/6) [Pullulanibacillus pueri]GGH80246.1 D-alanyl-D-alanine carboxypeptidase DacA [Pullulanibacillus pueri]